MFTSCQSPGAIVIGKNARRLKTVEPSVALKGVKAASFILMKFTGIVRVEGVHDFFFGIDLLIFVFLSGWLK